MKNGNLNIMKVRTRTSRVERILLKTDEKGIKSAVSLMEGYPLLSRNWQRGRSMRRTFNWQLFVKATRPTP